MAGCGARTAARQSTDHWSPGLGQLRPGVHGTLALVERLHELGWIEGRTIAIEYRWSQARPERAAEIAAEFVHRKVDLVVTAGPHVAVVKQVTAVIPSSLH